MGRAYQSIDERWRQFIQAQKVFFVGSAPLSPEGHVNVSPKGQDSFRILGPRRVAYLDLGGSGIETVAHVRENRRVVLVFCAFEGPPRILRLYGRGTVVEPDDPAWPDLAGQFPSYEYLRAIIDVELTRIRDSCGYGVPLFRYQGERTQLADWAARKGGKLRDYEDRENARSLDGLPGLPAAVRRVEERDRKA